MSAPLLPPPPTPEEMAKRRARGVHELTRYCCSLYVAGDIKSVGDVLCSLTRVQEGA